VKSKRYTLVAGFLALGLVAVMTIDYFAFPNLRICKSLQPGISQSELITALGAPFRSQQDGHFVTLYFKSHPVAAGPIRARVDSVTGRVVTLRCSEDGAPLWDEK
jgi:hypothetical protein